jgi:hypothetical protein
LSFSTPNIIAFVLIVLCSAVLLYFMRRYKERPAVSLRNIKAYETLQKNVSKAVADGRTIHFSAGRGALETTSNPASLAALAALDSIVEDTATSNKPPLVTSGDGSLFIASQDALRESDDDSRTPGEIAAQAQFIAPTSSPLAYGAGVSDVVNRGDFGSNVIMGRLGPELALITESAERERLEQVIGTDDLVALSVAFASTDDVLIGEELYAAAAYLRNEPAHIASLQLQDVLRIFVTLSILIAAIVSLFLS